MKIELSEIDNEWYEQQKMLYKKYGPKYVTDPKVWLKERKKVLKEIYGNKNNNRRRKVV